MSTLFRYSLAAAVLSLFGAAWTPHLSAQTTISQGQTLSGSQTGNYSVGPSISFNTQAGTTFDAGTTTFGGNDTINATGALSVLSGGIWNSSGSITLYGQSGAGDSFTNNGAITTLGGWFSGENNAMQLTNTGTITNTNNAFQFGYYGGDAVSNSGTMTAISNGGVSSTIALAGNSVTNSGTGQLNATTMGNGSSAVYFGNSDNNITLSNAGSITATSNGGGSAIAYLGTSSNGTTFNNTGTITANGANAVVNLESQNSSDTWTNGGSITATNGGTVNLGGVFSNANLTGVTINGSGTLNFVGTLNNSGALTGPAGGGSYTLDGGTISGGSVDGSNGALVFSNNGGILNNVSLNNNFNIGANTYFGLAGTTAFNGNVTFGGNNSLYLYASTPVTIGANQTWTANGVLNMYAQVAGSGVINNGTMSFGNGGWISGQNEGNFTIQNSGTISNTNASLQLGYYNGDSLTNSGTISSVSSNNSSPDVNIGGSNNTLTNTSAGVLSAVTNGNGNSEVTFGEGNNSVITNAGKMTANVASGGGSATLNIETSGGGNTFTNTGTITANGANAQINLAYSTGNTWDNSGGTITLTQGATLDLGGVFGNSNLGTINGANGTVNITGTLNNTGTLAGPTNGIFDLRGGTINGGTIDGSLNILQFTNGGGTLANVQMTNNFNIAANSYFSMAGTSSFDGSVAFGGNDSVYLQTASTTLTIAGGATWSSQASLNVYGQASGQTVANQGTITTNGGWISGQNNPNFVINNTGSITNSGGNSLQLGYYNGDSLTNSGTILDSTSNGASPTLSIGGSNNTITNSGTIESLATGNGNAVVYVGNGNNSTVNNTGTLEANGANAYLVVSANNTGNSWTNTGGTIESLNGGTIDFEGSFTTATLTGGTILGAGGTLNLVGSLNNTGATLQAPTNNSGIYTLDGGTITGGTVDATLNALQFSSNNGTLNNVSLVNDFTIGQSATFTVDGTTSFGGNVSFGGNNSIYFGTPSTFTIPSGKTWSDAGTLNFYAQSAGVTIANQGSITTNGGWMAGQGYGSFSINNSGSITNSNNSLQIGYYSGDSLVNSGTILNLPTGNNSSTLSIGGSNTTSSNSGTIEAEGSGPGNSYVYVANGTSSTFNNTGTLEASGSHAYLQVGGNNTANTWTNTGGTIEAVGGGTVDFQGSYTTATLNAGTILGAGGTLDLQGSLNNAGMTLQAPTNNSGVYTLYGGSINGGTVDGNLNALQFSGNNGTLNNVSMVNNFTVGQNDQFTIAGTTSFTGNVSFAGGNSVYFSTPGTFTIANGTTWSDSGVLNFYAQSSGVTIANQGAITVDGGWFAGQGYGGFLLNNSGTITNSGGQSLQLGYYNGDSLTNSGTILDSSSDNTSPSLSIGGSSNTVTNSGTIEALATSTGNAQVYVANGSNSTLNNSGTLEANGAHAYLTVSADNTGNTWSVTGSSVIEALNGGTVNLAGSFTSQTLATGQILGAGGTLNLTGSLNNAGATLAAPTTGIYTLDGGSISGGTVDGALNALAFSGNGGVLNNVSMIDNFTVAQNAQFTLEGTTTFSGNVTLNGGNSVYLSSANTTFTLPSTGSWTDSGGLTFYAQANGVTLANQGAMSMNGGWFAGQGYNNFLINNSGTISNIGGNGLQLDYYSGDSMINSGTITTQGTGGGTATTAIGGSNNTISNSGTMQALASGNSSATLYVGNGNSTTVTNAVGGVMAASNTGTGNVQLVIGSGSGTSFTNQGTVSADGAKATAYVDTATNLAGGTLTGGTWSASNGGTLQFAGGPITTNAATVDIDGAGSTILTNNGSQSLQQTLTTNNGTLSLDPVTFANSNALTNNGTIQLAGATISAPSLTNTATGTITGNGTVGVQVANQGNVTAAGGTLTMTNGIVGTSGAVQVNSGATLSLAGGATSSTAGTLADNGNLALGSNNVTVSSSYTNANFGTGNSFNARAGVTGTGQILAAGNTAETITGATVTGGTSSAPTLTLANMRVGGSQSVSYSVENSGTSGPSFVGALQTNVNGGNITDSRLTGSGVTAGNFGPLSSGQSQGYTVTENGTSAGALAAGQTVEVQSNFSNVGPQTITLSGGSVYQPAEANTLSNVSVGNFHVGSGSSSAALTIENIAPNTNGYTETLGASVTGSSGLASATGSVTGLSFGQSSTGISVSLSKGTAGNVSGTDTIDFQTQAINNSGLGDLDLGSQTVTVSGTGYDLAQASVQPNSPISLGNTRIGGSLTQALTITNSGANSGGFTETLSGNVSGNSGSATSAGSISGVTQGSSNNTGVNVSLSTASAGAITGSTTLAFNSNAINNSGLGTTALQSQTVNLTGDVYQAAVGQVNGTPINLGNFHVGQTASTDLSVSNVAPGTGGFTENLGATIGGTTGGASASGSVTGLAVGGTNTTGISVGLSTASAGNLSGTATVDFQTQAINNSGLGTASVGSQTVDLTGTAYALAAASVQPSSPISLGNARIGGTLNQALTISNSGASTGGFTETLSGNVSGNSGSATSAGSVSGIAQGGSNNTGVNVSLSTATAGAITGSTSLAFNSNAIDNSGLGTTALSGQTVNLTGAVYQEAVGQVNNGSPLNLGNFHVGQTASANLSVSNVAPGTGGYTENLGATIGGTTGGASASGSVTGLAVGGTNTTGITVGLSTASAGNLSGSTTVDFQTQAINNSGLGTASVGSQTLDLTGTAYALAQASVLPNSPISLGNARIGGTLSQNLTITNSAANTGGFTESLSGDVSGNTGSATSAGSVSGIAQGGSNNTGVNVSLSTAAAGAITGSTTVAFNSNAINNSGLGTTALQSQTVNLTGAVYQAAQGQVTNSSINLGNFHVGDTASTALTVQNVAPSTGGYTENLGATVTGATGQATTAGSVTGLQQGASSTAISVGLNTSAAGALSGTATVGFQTQAINNSGLGTASVGSQTVTVQGAAYNLASASLGTIDFGKVLEGSAAAQYLSVANTAAANGFSEGLDANIAGFSGASANLLSGSGQITNLAAGTSNANTLQVSLNTSTVGTVSANVLVNLASDGLTTSGLGITTLTQQQAGVSGDIYVEAQVGSLASASAATPNPVNLGNVRVGQTSPTQALSLTNTASGPAEGLNASIGGTTGGITASGSFTSLQAGNTDSSSLQVGMNTATAGNKSGTATITLASDGTYNNGVQTSLGTQTVDVTGAVYQSAQAGTLAAVNLGNFHVGQTATTGLNISNVAQATGGYTENLGASVTGTAGQGTASGAVTGLQQGASTNTGITVGLNTNTAGALSGSATIDFQTQAINNSGLGTADVGSQTVDLTGTAYALAAANVQPLSPISLGNARIGGTLSQALSISNSGASTGGFTETLSGNVSGNSGSATSTGSVSGITQGGSNSTGVNVSLSTAAAGAITGSTSLAFNSNAIDNSGLGTTALSGQTVNLTGAVYQEAQGLANNGSPLNLGNFHVGQTASANLSVSNVAPGTGGYTENLGATIGGTTGGASASGSVTGLTVGGTNTNGITVGLNTSSAGSLSGTATVNFQTQAINNSGLGTADVGSQTVAIEGAAYQLAQASTQPTTVNLGASRIGGTLSQSLNVGNAAPNTNGYTENLGGSASGNGSGSFSGLAQGQSTNALTVSLSTSQAGAVSGAANLSFESEAINNSGLGTTALSGQTVNLTGAVYQTAAANALPSSINLGTLRVGSSVSTALNIQNVAPDTNGYTETLGASFGSVSSGLTSSGSLSGLAQGASSTALSLIFNAGSAGNYNGSAAVNFDSEAIDNSGLGDLSLGSQTVDFSAVIDALAEAAVDKTGGGGSFQSTGADSGVLNFGDITGGQGDLNALLDLSNDVSGPADELLSLVDASGLSGSPFSYYGSSSFDLGAGQGSGFNISFDTDGSSGEYEAVLTFGDSSHNDDQADLGLGNYELTIEGDILSSNNGGGSGSSGVPDAESTLLLFGAILVSAAAARRWVGVAL